MNTEPTDKIVIRDIDIPFGRLVLLLLKLMLASIPAIIVFYLLFAVLALVFLAIFGGGAAFWQLSRSPGLSACAATAGRREWHCGENAVRLVGEGHREKGGKVGRAAAVAPLFVPPLCARCRPLQGPLQAGAARVCDWMRAG